MRSQQRKQEAQRRIRREIKPLLAEGSVLEIGCASGSFLAAMRENNYKIAGIDISQEFARQAKEINNIDIALLAIFLRKTIQISRSIWLLCLGQFLICLVPEDVC